MPMNARAASHGIKLLYCTAKDASEAGRIASILVEERLAACVNVLPEGQSVYTWEGKLQREKECYFIVKTTVAMAPSAAARIRELHSYAVPCVLQLDADALIPEFGDWVSGSVATNPGSNPPRDT